MIGTPKELKTKQDYLNAAEYAVASGEGKAALRNRLLGLKNNSTMLVLKKASEKKPSEEQTEDDFEAVSDPACEKNRLGFSDREIDQLIGDLT